MTGSSGTNTACAACKYQRRKCSPECPLAPYFPPDQPKRFANVHKLFGVSNLLRLLKHVDAAKREDTVKSIAYEADTREKDPVHGCLGVVTVLQNQVARLREELHLARDQIFFLEQQALASAPSYSSPFHDDQDPHFPIEPAPRYDASSMKGGYYFGNAYDESPVSHHQMHLQAAFEQDQLRSSSSSGSSGYGVDVKPDHDHEEFRVYLSLTNQQGP